MATTKFQGFPTYRYAQIALKGTNNHVLDKNFVPTISEETVDTRKIIQEFNKGSPTKAMQQSGGHYPTYNAVEELEVDFEHNVTDLYQAISNSQWDVALDILRKNPQEARTWVVRYKEDDTKSVMWRFLPIHSACARQPPKALVISLMQVHPSGAESCDDQGMYPLHYASGNQASADVIQSLVQAFPDAANIGDPKGMLPVHYMSQWGPSETKAIDALLLATAQSNVKDDEGNTSLHYAEEGDYPLRHEMIAALRSGPLSNIQMKKFNHSLPPMSRRNLGNASSTKKIPSAFTTNQSSSNISKLDEPSVAETSPQNMLYKEHTYGTNQSVSNTPSVSNPPYSSNKTVNRLSAQVRKLRADLEFSAAECEENLTNQREQHEAQVQDLNTKILKAIDDNSNVRLDIKTKIEYTGYVQNRTSDVEKDITHFTEQNDRLHKDLARNDEDLRLEKSKAEAFQMKIKTLSYKMNSMVEDQAKIQTSLASIEKDFQTASQQRMKKLQELYDDEMKCTNELMALKQVYGVAGPTILQALDQQKNLMENCKHVLSECEDNKENHPSSPPKLIQIEF